MRNGRGIESHVEARGIGESGIAEDHIREAVKSGVSVKKFYGDGAFDASSLFSLLHSIGAKPIIKIRKNASNDYYHKGGKARRREVREYKEMGYERWPTLNQHGMRWPGTEGIFSAVKRKYGENCVSRSIEGLMAEGYQMFWAYDYINQKAKHAMKTIG